MKIRTPVSLFILEERGKEGMMRCLIVSKNRIKLKGGTVQIILISKFVSGRMCFILRK